MQINKFIYSKFSDFVLSLSKVQFDFVLLWCESTIHHTIYIYTTNTQQQHSVFSILLLRECINLRFTFHWCSVCSFFLCLYFLFLCIFLIWKRQLHRTSTIFIFAMQPGQRLQYFFCSCYESPVCLSIPFLVTNLLCALGRSNCSNKWNVSECRLSCRMGASNGWLY